MNMTYNKEIAAAIEQFLQEDGWHYSFDGKRGVFTFQLSVRSKLQQIEYSVRVRRREYIVYGILPLGGDRKDKDLMARLAEFVCRINYGMYNGNFELDFRDGELRYKSYVDCEDALPGRKVIKNSISCTAAMCNRYAPGLLDILFGGASAEQAEDKCEEEGFTRVSRLLFGEDGDDTMRGESDLDAAIERLKKLLDALEDSGGDEEDDGAEDE